MLVKKCTCGNSIEVNSDNRKISCNGIDIYECQSCGVISQRVEMTEEEYANFYAEHYHIEHQEAIGRESYVARYDHDLAVARQRLIAYGYTSADTGKVLDIGCGNGAFVAACRELGLDAYGIDLGHISESPYILSGTLLEMDYAPNSFSLVTLHDVLEHLVNPVNYLKKIFNIIETNTGKLIIDYPRYYHPAGRHHWRPTEHLWYHTTGELITLLERLGFDVFKVTTPISSKIVVYCSPKNPR